ncbi:hypothetical protein S7711_03756 [Stachybotrys chartarum IBT 7711]|uniref:MARVEL domain-containing protein n=1 Tax=Stachybotrys chartarum (strain CBS 109288 / IBT 7711) TaxID=1280523 RepID=A0A084AWU8_STACB|nr:hypothetical protein S7711_03756 [Stachybotrys chartarum IBT 7711]KFA49463.1 hypothetical protein S40293_05786 [Stachybotrys chartarum IBT 40293]
MAWTYWFDSRFSLRVHCVQCVLILAAVILTIVRIAMPAPFTTRAHMMALAMGIKSLIFIGYQLASAHMARFAKWHSLKANAILNCLEVVFWATAMGLLFQANGQTCSGASCGVSWVIALLALVLL